MSDLLMLDTVDVSTLAGLRFDALAGYVGGFWPTFSPMCAQYPLLAKQGRIFSYAVNVHEDAELADCETGDLTVQEVVDVWLPRQFARKVWRPGVYANLSRWVSEGLKSETDHLGDSIRRIVADWTFRQSLDIPWGDGQQYTDRYGGRNIDGNLIRPTFVPPQQQPPHANDPHYDWFASGPIATFHWGTVDERKTAEAYDSLRKMQKRNANEERDIHRLMSICAGLANRVSHAAHADPDPNGRPQWGLHHRGWRRLQLSIRGHGTQVA